MPFDIQTSEKMPFFQFQFQDLNEKLSTTFRPWQRSCQFWLRATDIYAGYKICQVRVKFVKGGEKQEEMWEKQHELAAEKIYSMCSELGGFFLKAAQILGKPDLAPAAWVRRLVTLCDRAPATPFEVIKLELEKDLGRNIGEIFERFDIIPVGSASIAQVHRARMRGSKTDVAIKVQHPGVQDLMMTDIRNLKAFALYLQNTDIKFDLFSVTKEIEKQVALLDYGQVKHLPDDLRLGYANLIMAIADNDPMRTIQSYKDLGIQTSSTCVDEQNEMMKLAQTMFDTKLPPGVTMLTPFAEESSIKKIAVQTFPEELFSILRTVHLLRGLSVGLGINYSCAEQWKPIAKEALYAAGRLKDKDPNVHKRGFLRRIFWRN